MSASLLRVLLIEASPLALRALQTTLATSGEVEVVGAVSQGRAGLAQAIQLRPDVLCLSTQMTGLTSLQLVHEVMSQCCCPILVLHNEDESPADLLQAGAVDAWVKPAASWAPTEILSAQLGAKIKRVAQIPVISRSRTREAATQRPVERGTSPSAPTSISSTLTTHSPDQTPHFPTSLAAPLLPTLHTSSRVVVVGASTGGPQALVALFSGLPRDFPCPILCVQHISKGFLNELINWLDASCRLKVKIAAAGEVPQPGTIYFGVEDRHLELDARGRIWFSTAPPVDGHRPSVTTLFQSVARTRGKSAIAVLLTGMGGDGAKGMQAVAEAGGTTFAQEETSCVVFGMPKEAIALGAAQHVLKPEDIARKLLTLAAASP